MLRRGFLSSHSYSLSLPRCNHQQTQQLFQNSSQLFFAAASFSTLWNNNNVSKSSNCFGGLHPLTPIGKKGHCFSSVAVAAAAAAAAPLCWVQQRSYQQVQNGGNSGQAADDEEEFSFDASAAISQDARKVSQQDQVQSLVNELVATIPVSPPPPEAAAKLLEIFTREPINDCIKCERVVITHVQNEAGEDSKLKMPEMSFQEAMDQAKENGRDLVQVAMNKGVAYCRLRDAKARAMAQIEPIIAAAEAAAAAAAGVAAGKRGGGVGGKHREREMKVHSFRDVADSHFCSWRGKKVVGELARGHPIKLQINHFLTPESAARKMQEMLEAVQSAATTDDDFESGLKKEKRPDVGHQSTGIHVSEKELAVTLKPTEAGGPVKHPSDGDWKAAVRRHEEICRRTDRKTIGTYKESKTLKRKSGATTFRVDKYGRKKE